jgi:hypothetical protein
VWARDEVTGDVRLCEVEETYRNESPVILEVTAGGETLATTPGHPFWVLHVGWKDAGELEVGDHLVTLRGESVVVEDIRRRPVPEPVFNFSVAGLHTYFVGQGGIWVHNNSGTGCGVGGKTSKDPVKPGDTGTYGDLNARKRSHGETEPLDMDHQPSFAAQVSARESALGRPLTPAERAAVKASTPAVASPRVVHQQTSPTYGGRNTPERISQDAADLPAAQARDRSIFDKAMENR